MDAKFADFLSVSNVQYDFNVLIYYCMIVLQIIVPATVTGVESTPEFEIQWLSVEESGFLESDISQLISGEVNIIKVRKI